MKDAKEMDNRIRQRYEIVVRDELSVNHLQAHRYHLILGAVGLGVGALLVGYAVVLYRRPVGSP